MERFRLNMLPKNLQAAEGTCGTLMSPLVLHRGMGRASARSTIERLRTLTRLLMLAWTLTSCGDVFYATCEKKCYAQKTNEPRDFDDCIRRCQK